MRDLSSNLGDGSPDQTLQLEDSCGHWSALPELRSIVGIFEERKLAQSFSRIILRSYLKTRYKWIYCCFNFRTNEPSKSKPERTIKAHPLNLNEKKKKLRFLFPQFGLLVKGQMFIELFSFLYIFSCCPFVSLSLSLPAQTSHLLPAFLSSFHF